MRLAKPEDIERIHAVSHHPANVEMTHAFGAPLFDMSPYLKTPHGVLLCDGGHFALARHEEGVYEFHTTFLPSARGREMIRQSRDALWFMFIETQCEVLHTHVPANHPGAAFLVKSMGFRKSFSRTAAWHARDGFRYDVDYFTMRIEDWIAQGHCEAAGREFHVELSGLGLKDHPDDPAHDYFVGGALEMVRAGRVDKALRMYARWARIAGYEVPRRVSPVRVEFSEFALNLGENGKFAMEVKRKCLKLPPR